MKKVTLGELTELISLDEYQNKWIEKLIEKFKTVSNFHTAKLIFEVEERDGNFYLPYNAADIYLEHPFLDIKISYWEHDEKWRIFENNSTRLPNISGYDLNEIKKQFKEPNQIGVLTQKKIFDWIKYLECAYDACKKASDINTVKITKFEEKLSRYPIKWNKDGKSGYYEKGGLEYIFAFVDGFIRQEIKVDTITNFENFLKMADNKHN